jgi:O-methyltransferase
VKAYERVIDRTARRLGLNVSRLSSQGSRLPVEAGDADSALISSLRPFTMTSSERLWSLISAVRYLVTEGIEGDLVECGVWRGGSVMAMAHELIRLGVPNRRIWLYDTFTGMTAPSDKDVEAATGILAADMLASTSVGDGNNVWCVAARPDVEANIRSTGYPFSLFSIVEGDVSMTVRDSAPDEIALLRLDTDWYESTRDSLEVMFPRLAVGGVCILDDYGHWTGARRAVDEYFARWGTPPFMHTIDYSGRIFVKTDRLT